jgi:predicted DNA-binding transcriptional regulator AlpA
VAVVVAAGGDFLTLDELTARLKTSPKTIKHLTRNEAFPLRRVTPRGTVYVFWSEVERWLKTRKSPEFR